MEFTLFKEEKSFPHDLNTSHPKVHEHVHNLLVKADRLKCTGCGKEFDSRNLEVWLYDHSSGWDVGLEKSWGSENGKQWLSILCNCGHHTSFEKLGIGRVW
jgi:hypothetical protein